MFILDQTGTFIWPVKLKVPADGVYQEMEFLGEFKRVDQERLDAILDPAQPVSDADLVDEIWLGWRSGVINDAKQGVAATPENKAALLKVAGMRRAIVVSYLDCMLGRGQEATFGKGAEKN
jgi:hypothetical protein